MRRNNLAEGVWNWKENQSHCLNVACAARFSLFKKVKMLLVDVERSSLSKTARSLLHQIMAVNLCRNVSWKGQQRKDQEERKEAFQSLMISKLLRKCVEITWPRESGIGKKIKATVSTWLAQRGSAYLKKQKSGEDSSAETSQLNEQLI